MLRRIRIILAAAFFAVLTLLLLGLVPTGFSAWIAKLQFVPALMAANLAVVLGLVLLTFLFGRIYCSVICPLGVFQDIVARLGRLFRGKKGKPYGWSRGIAWLRYTFLALFVAAMLAGVQAVVAVLDPYSSYGRIVTQIFSPGRMAVTSAVFIVAAASLVLVAALAWKGGRTYCNSVCPVGSALGLVSRFALFRPVIDKAKCKSCHLCEKRCKASCISIDEKKIDLSRCVDCFDCLDSCRFGALHYRFVPGFRSGASCTGGEKKQSPDSSRRAFLAAGAAFVGAGALKAQSSMVDGGYAAITAKQIPPKTTPLTPFGSKSVKDFYNRCTACQLCVAACPNRVLRPSSDLEHFMQPEMAYERGYCRPECTKCSEVCPSGAIVALKAEQKLHFKIGTASVNRELCVVETQGLSCGNCARHCPAGAILMVPVNEGDKDSLLRPTVVEAQCIGCGACENLCPSRPISAITVDGIREHIIS